MRHVYSLGLGILTAVAAGCVGSVNPVVTDRAAMFEPRLLGTWTDSGSSERAVITQAGPRAYAIQYTDEQGQTTSLDGMLGRSGGGYILDVQAAAAALGPYKDLVVRLHIPLILDSMLTRVHTSTLQVDSLDGYLRSHPGAVPHVRTHDGLTLTGSSSEVERFFAMYLQRRGVLEKASAWIHQSP